MCFWHLQLTSPLPGRVSRSGSEEEIPHISALDSRPGIRRLARHTSKGSEEAGRVVAFAAERKRRRC
jgi:hypothetical protein